MKRFAHLILVAGLAFAPLAFAQEQPTAADNAAKREELEKQEKELEKKEAEEKRLVPWKWANFLILAGALGYGIGKAGPRFFAGRAAGIRKEIEDAEAARAAAESRTAEVERRLASLEAEVAAIRTEAQAQAEAGAARMSAETTAHIAKIQSASEQEIASAGKAARAELKRYSAHLAVQLAEQKVRSRMSPAEQDSLVEGFERSLAEAKARTL